MERSQNVVVVIYKSYLQFNVTKSKKKALSNPIKRGHFAFKCQPVPYICQNGEFFLLINSNLLYLTCLLYDLKVVGLNPTLNDGNCDKASQVVCRDLFRLLSIGKKCIFRMKYISN